MLATITEYVPDFARPGTVLQWAYEGPTQDRRAPWASATTEWRDQETSASPSTATAPRRARERQWSTSTEAAASSSSAAALADSDAEAEQRRDPIAAFVCGAAAGTIAKSADYPLDTIKTQMQLGSRSRGVAGCARQIWQRDGIRGFYAGLSAPVLGCALCNAGGFSAFALGTTVFDRLNSPAAAEADRLPAWMRDVFGGAAAGLWKAHVLTPLELVKCRIQADPRRYNGVLHCGADCYAREGLHALYRGHAPMLLREVAGNAVWFASYEALMRAFTPAGGARSDIHPVASMVAAGSSGIVFWSCVMPFDTVKTRLQVVGHVYGSTRVVPAVAKLAVREGVAGLYAGFVPTCYRTVPASILLFRTYDGLMSLWAGSSAN